MNSWQQLMADWVCPNPENIFSEEIPDEIEAYEFWDTWRHAIEAIWPNEPDISHPPEE